MKIRAHVQNSEGSHYVKLETNDKYHTLQIPPKSTGFGSSTNGGELLFLALATCYCNDIYREAEKRGIEVERVEVVVDGNFDAEGQPAKNVKYNAKVVAQGREKEIRELMNYTDQVAEIHNTLRIETPVTLGNIKVVTV